MSSLATLTGSGTAQHLREGARQAFVPSPTKAKTLYISYDGVLEPLGESQVVSYLERLAQGCAITLLSFEKARDRRDVARWLQMRARLDAVGIHWVALRYHKHPPVLSTAYDVLRGGRQAVRWAARHRTGLVHARGYVAALIALLVQRRYGNPWIFDMRGFWADEKVEGGQWSRRSFVYWVTKRCERRFFESAQAVVSLTQAGRQAIARLGYRVRSEMPIEVIPTCTDLTRFRPGTKDATLLSRLGLAGHRVIGCTGSLSHWYLRWPMLEYLAYLVHHLELVKVLILTREDRVRLRADALRAGIPAERLVVTSAPFAEMPRYVRLMDAGLFFIRPCFSKQGSAATKLGEFLATGVPVVINDGVGDSGWLVREQRVGLVLPTAAADAFEASLPLVRDLLEDRTMQSRCRETAETYCNLERGVEQYAALYERVSATARHRWNGGTVA